MLQRIKPVEDDGQDIRSAYDTIKEGQGLSYNHFISLKSSIDPQVKLEIDTLI